MNRSPLLPPFVFCCLLSSAPAQAEWGASASVASDYVVNGVARSHSGPVFQAQSDWTNSDGWAASLSFSTLNPAHGYGPKHEIDVYLGKRWVLARDWAVRAEVSRYTFRPSHPWLDYDYTEVRAAVSFREVAEFTAAWSPDYSTRSLYGVSEHGITRSYDLTGRYPATRWLSLTTGIGYYDLHELVGTGYWYWSAGAEMTFGRVSLAASYIGTDDTALDLFGARQADDRLTASFAFKLR